jgi:hypothetical protein
MAARANANAILAGSSTIRVIASVGIARAITIKSLRLTLLVRLAR